MTHTSMQGDALRILPTLPERSVDAMVCDPPAGIDFMGKDWDGNRGEQADQNWQPCKAPIADWWLAAAILAPLLFPKGGH
jgi:DNA modification methylase